MVSITFFRYKQAERRLTASPFSTTMERTSSLAITQLTPAQNPAI